jgi:hypothetical protein
MTNSIWKGIKYYTAPIALGLGLLYGAQNPAYAQDAGKKDIAVIDMYVEKADGQHCVPVVDQICDGKNPAKKDKKAPAKKKGTKKPGKGKGKVKAKPKPQPKPTPQAPIKVAKDDCYNLLLGHVDSNDNYFDDNITPTEGDTKCSLGTATIDKELRYVLSANNKGEYFKSVTSDAPDAYTLVDEVRDNNGNLEAVIFKASKPMKLKTNVVNRYGTPETDELAIQVLEPKPVPISAPQVTEKPVVKEDKGKITETIEEITIECTENCTNGKAPETKTKKSVVEAAGAVHAGYLQNTLKRPDIAKPVEYGAVNTGAMLGVGFNLSDNVQLMPLGRFSYTKGENVEGMNYSGDLVLRLHADNDQKSNIGNAEMFFGAGYLGERKNVKEGSFNSKQNNQGGEFILHLNAPRLFSASEDFNAGLEAGTNVGYLTLNENGKANGSEIRWNVYAGPNFMFNKDKTKLYLLFEGSGNTNVENGKYKYFGYHLDLGFEHKLTDKVALGAEGFIPVDMEHNDEYGGRAYVTVRPAEFSVVGKHYNADSKLECGPQNQSGNYFGAEVKLSTEGLLDKVLDKFGKWFSGK